MGYLVSSFARALREIGEFFLSLVVDPENREPLLTYRMNKPERDKETLEKAYIRCGWMNERLIRLC